MRMRTRVWGWRGWSAMLAVAALGVATVPGAHATMLQFSYSDSGGLHFSFDQSSSPTPISYGTGEGTQVGISHWSGDVLGSYSSIIWWSTAEGGMFTLPNLVDVYGPQVYSGTEAHPQFTSGSFSGSESSVGGDGSWWCGQQIRGTLTVKGVTPTVPESGSLGLFAGALGLLGLAVLARRRARS